MSNIQQMRKIAQPQTRKVGFIKIWIGDHWFGAIFARHFSIYITLMFVKLGLTANMVTLLMIISGISGSVLMVPHILWLNIIGFFFLFLTETLDAVDGEVARWNNQCSIKGRYLDLVSHILCNSMFYVFCPLHLYFIENKVVYLVLAFVSYAASHCVLGLSYAHQIIKSSYSDNSAGENTDSYKEKTSFRKNKIWVLIKAASYSTDMVVIATFSSICMLLSYGGIILPMIVLVWFIAISQTVLMFGRILHKYFIQLPDIKHKRKTGFEVT